MSLSLRPWTPPCPLMESKYAFAPATVWVPRNLDGPSGAEQEAMRISLSVTPGVCAKRARGKESKTKMQNMAARERRSKKFIFFSKTTWTTSDLKHPERNLTLFMRLNCRAVNQSRRAMLQRDYGTKLSCRRELTIWTWCRRR